MTLKEKAKELVGKFMPYADGVDIQEDHDQIEKHLENAKQCALIAVDEIIEHIENSYHNEDIIKGAKSYWIEVKQEIEIL
jgi:hypothetical protein